MGQEIVIDIDPTGDNVKVEVKGCKGASCKDLTRNIENALGQPAGVEHTDEFYENEITNQQEQRRTLGH